MDQPAIRHHLCGTRVGDCSIRTPFELARQAVYCTVAVRPVGRAGPLFPPLRLPHPCVLGKGGNSLYATADYGRRKTHPISIEHCCSLTTTEPGAPLIALSTMRGKVKLQSDGGWLRFPGKTTLGASRLAFSRRGDFLIARAGSPTHRAPSHKWDSISPRRQKALSARGAALTFLAEN